MNFWENVEFIREIKEISRKELAYRARFSINSISTGIARGSFPAVDVACRIAKELGVSVEFLVNGEAAKGIPQSDKVFTDEETRILRHIDSSNQNFMRYSTLVQDFSVIPPEIQKPLEELIHKVSAGGTVSDGA